MYKMQTNNNVATKKTLIVSIVSLLLTCLLTPQKKGDKRKRRNKSSLKRYNKTFKFLNSILSYLRLNIIKENAVKENNDIKIEQAIFFDL